MEQDMQFVLAKGIINSYIEKNETIYELKRGKIVEKGLVNTFNLLENLLKNKLSLLISFEIKEYASEPYTFMEHLIRLDGSPKLIQLICSNLTKEDVSQLNSEIVNRCYSHSENSIPLLEKLFQLGFDFEQGKFDEVNKAIQGDIEFFELCHQIKPNFKFGFKYDENATLDEILKDEVEYEKSNHGYPEIIKKKESLCAFLKKAREVEELKENLNQNLTTNSSTSPTIKKV